MATRYRLKIPRDIYVAMVAHAWGELPNECCGLLAGQINDGIAVVTKRLPLVNDAASPREFCSEPRSMLEAEKTMRAEGLDLAAIYHSHPASAPIPSRTDLERNYSESVLNLIISLEFGQAEMRAWWLGAEHFVEGEWSLEQIID